MIRTSRLDRPAEILSTGVSAGVGLNRVCVRRRLWPRLGGVWVVNPITVGLHRDLPAIERRKNYCPGMGCGRI